jgi:GNAT superfamily N-acetyltransferase
VHSDVVARRATVEDRASLVTVIGLAFAQDPLWSRALRNAQSLSAYWGLFVDAALRFPWIWVAGDFEAVALWTPPGEVELTEQEVDQILAFARANLGADASDFIELLGRFDAAHPHAEPHYYLGFLATHPDHRGHGIGMGLLAHNLALIDAEHRPAYLESSNPANNRRYEAAGFEAVGEFTYPGEGPVVTCMWRPAR